MWRGSTKLASESTSLRPLTAANGWATVQHYATEGVPYSLLLHQRHYGGAFRQVLDATSKRRGDLIEDAVETLFRENGIPHIRTGSQNQSEIAERFEVQVTPTAVIGVQPQTADRSKRGGP